MRFSQARRAVWVCALLSGAFGQAGCSLPDNDTAPNFPQADLRQLAAQPPPPGMARIVIYRLHAYTSSALGAGVYVDGKLLADVSDKWTTQVMVPSGAHKIDVHARGGMMPLPPLELIPGTFQADIPDGQTVFLEIAARASEVGLPGGGFVSVHGGSLGGGPSLGGRCGHVFCARFETDAVAMPRIAALFN